MIVKDHKYFIVNAFRVIAVLIFIWGFLVCWGISISHKIIEEDKKNEDQLVEEYMESVGEKVDADDAIPEAGTNEEGVEPVVEETEPVETAAVDENKVYTAFDLTYCNGAVNVRSTPTSQDNSNIIGKMKKGESGYILEDTEEGWVLVVTANIQGYIAKKFVEESEVTGAELADFFPEEYR